MPVQCCVFGCNSRSGNGTAISFHRFPVNRVRSVYWLKKWVRILRLGKKLKLSASRVCSRHFSEKQYEDIVLLRLKRTAVPDQNLPKKPIQITRVTASQLQRRQRAQDRLRNEEINFYPLNIDHQLPDNSDEDILQNDPLALSPPVPHDNTTNENEFEINTAYITKTYERKSIQINATKFVEPSSMLVAGEVEVYTTGQNSSSVDQPHCSYNYVPVQGASKMDIPEEEKSSTTPQENLIQHIHRSDMLVVSKLTDDEIKYLTGHSKNEFNVIFDFVLSENIDVSWPYQSLPLKEQLLLTLMKYRLNYDFVFLGITFKMSLKAVSAVFRHWTHLLYGAFSMVNFWETRAKSDALYTVILDCTEIAIEKPTLPEKQQATWSSYKNCNTFKGLVGIDEAGTVIFVSDLFGGAASDDVIVSRSGVLDLLTEGDFVLADRGFEASDVMAEKGITLNKPPKKKGAQMSETEVAHTRAIASRRVNVERVIGLVKKNRILTQKVPHHLFDIMSRIFRLLFMLVNIKPSICRSIEPICECKK